MGKLSRSAALLCALSLTVASQAQPSADYRWGTVMMGGGGFVSAIITSKAERNLIYARTDVGGAYRWDEARKGWVSIMDWVGADDMGLFGVDALAVDPSNPSRVYMLAGTEYWNQGKTMILRSDDYGATFDTVNVTSQFKTHGNGYGRQNGERLAVDPNNPNVLFCGTRDNGLWKSTDRGGTWAKVAGAPTLSNGLGICLVLFDGNRQAGDVTSRIYIGLSRDANNLYVSDDGGDTWESIAMPALSKPMMPQRAALTPGGRYLYVAAANWAGPGWGSGVAISRGAVLKYDTAEKTWSDISPENFVDDPPHPDFPGQTQWDAHFGGFGGISMCAADSNRLAVSTINTWTPQFWDGSGRIAHGDKIFVTDDGGENWVNVFGGLTDGDEGGITGSEPIAVLYKNGYNWIEGEAGGRGESIHWAGSIEIDPFDPKRVFVTSGNGIYMADNFSPGERFRFNFTVRGLEETVPMDLVSIPGGPLITVILDYDGFVHDDITRQVSGSRHSPRMGSTTGIDYAKLNPGVVVRVGGNDKPESDKDYRFPLYYSEDTARTWKKFATHPGPGQNYEGKISVSSDGRAVIWAPRGRNTILRTGDWGETWTAPAGLTPPTPHPTADPVDPNVFYVFGGGVYRSEDQGMTFTRASTGSASSHGVRNFDSWTNDMRATPGVKGHLWVVGHAWDGVNGGFLSRSTDGGESFHDVDPAVDGRYAQRVQHAEAVGFGKAADGADYPAIYIYGTIGGVKGVWQSVDEAGSWERIDDERYAFGALANGNFVRGDMNTFGVVYRSTAGRGVAARMPAEWLDNGAVSVRGPAVVNRPRSPFVKLRGQALTLAQPAGMALTVNVYDLRGRVVFGKTYRSAAILRSRDLVRANGSYVVTVRNAARETVFRGRLAVTGGATK